MCLYKINPFKKIKFKGFIMHIKYTYLYVYALFLMQNAFQGKINNGTRCQMLGRQPFR